MGDRSEQHFEACLDDEPQSPVVVSAAYFAAEFGAAQLPADYLAA